MVNVSSLFKILFLFVLNLNRHSDMTHEHKCGYEGGINATHDPDLHRESEYKRIERVSHEIFTLFLILNPELTAVKMNDTGHITDVIGILSFRSFLIQTLQLLSFHSFLIQAFVYF